MLYYMIPQLYFPVKALKQSEIPLSRAVAKVVLKAFLRQLFLKQKNLLLWS